MSRLRDRSGVDELPERLRTFQRKDWPGDDLRDAFGAYRAAKLAWAKDHKGGPVTVIDVLRESMRFRQARIADQLP